MKVLEGIFASNGFMPHGHCYLWLPSLVWLHAVSDGLIALAYATIPLTLVYIVRHRKDIPFNGMFFSFGTFIVACGVTHVMEIWTLWVPVYWLAGGIKAVTAVASVLTAIFLIRLVPRILTLPSHEALSLVNVALEGEVARRGEAERKMRGLNENLMNQAKQLEEINGQLEAFSYSVSHDLRAPLRHIAAYSELLRKQAGPRLDEPSSRQLDAISDSAARMGNQIEGLLEFARMSRTEMVMTTVPLESLVADVVNEIEARADSHGIVWKIGALPEVHGDLATLRMAIGNLVSNAVKYSGTREVPVIEIEAESRADETVVLVRDNGVGFDMAGADRLFGVFQRLHRAEDFEGTGIGLANVQRIIQRHGGRVWAEGAVDRGATFYFSLPSAIREAA